MLPYVIFLNQLNYLTDYLEVMFQPQHKLWYRMQIYKKHYKMLLQQSRRRKLFRPPAGSSIFSAPSCGHFRTFTLSNCTDLD
jgi:hypothetical protein